MRKILWGVLCLLLFLPIHVVWIFVVIPSMVVLAIFRFPLERNPLAPLVVAPLARCFEGMGLLQRHP